LKAEPGCYFDHTFNPSLSRDFIIGGRQCYTAPHKTILGAGEMSARTTRRKPHQIFYSYSHKDESLRDALDEHLSILERRGLVQVWHDRNIGGGDEWREAIDEQLETADIILLLISASFIKSDFCWSVEMKQALKKQERGEAHVIPIIVRPVEWTAAPFGHLQALPKDAKPVTVWTNRDMAWMDVVKGIQKAVEGLRSSAPRPPTTRGVRPEVPPMMRGVESLSPAPAPAPARTLKPASRPRTIDEPVAGRAAGNLRRVIYDAKNVESLPGEVARGEGDPPAGDAAVDETYDALGVTYDFFWNVFGRDSIDGKGMPLEATVHYGRDYGNAFWTGKQVILGDGDGKLFNRFSAAPDVIAKEFAMGLVQSETQLVYWEQSGAILQSFALALASLVKQYALGQKASEADWLIGEKLLGPKVNGKALYSLAAPGTAYDDPGLGKDEQPRHMRDYVKKEADNGGVHINSGILNYAFYLVATELGGYSWEKAGRIWYDTLTDGRLKPDAQFSDLARLTFDNARRLYGIKSDEAQAVKRGWETVGIKVAAK
jgi:Thermolysin metallopeptidase, alpha-helical domain/Thermolysin metallopeptidase, catalytic domain/TIR domain